MQYSKYETFEDYLTEYFTAHFTGTKDRCEVDCENWISNLDVQELIDFADAYGNREFNRGLNTR